MEPQTQALQLDTVSPIDGIERAQIDMQIATAKRYPRTLSRVKDAMLSFATLDEETAAACFYTLKRKTKDGEKKIEGPSVRLAEIALSAYGNIRVGVRIVSEVTTGENPHVVVQSVAHDLENNIAVSIEKRRAINSKKDWKTGVRFPVSSDDVNLAVNACSAIAFRDAIFKVAPRALINPVMEAAKRVAIGDVKSLDSKRLKVIDRLKLMGASEDRILAVVDARKVADIDLEKLETLLGLGTAVKDGELTLEQAFPAPTELPKPSFLPPTPALAPQSERTTAGEIVNPTPKRGRPKKQQPVEDDIPFDQAAVIDTMSTAVESHETSEQPVDPEPPRSIHQELSDFLKENSFTFDDFLDWGAETEMVPDTDSIPSVHDLPSKIALSLLTNKSGLHQSMRAFLELRKASK